MLTVEALLALVVASCAPSEVWPTQVVVQVDAELMVAGALRQVRAFVYPVEATDETRPSDQHLFTLTEGVERAGATRVPFSFGIAQRAAETQVRLVIKGYASSEPDAQALIERKELVTFVAGKTRDLRLTLRASCYRKVCAPLEQTCWPELGACGPTSEAETAARDESTGLRDAGDRDASDVQTLDGGTDAGPASEAGVDPSPAPEPIVPAPPVAPVPDPTPVVPPPPVVPPAPLVCPANHTCASPSYPCQANRQSGYTCLGQLADWPMPDSRPGSKFPPSYDTSTPGVVVDNVTGLIWQREPPATYPGCTGNLEVEGDSCTWSEAHAYCSQLTLDGQQWRLPSRIELSSIYDEREFYPAIDPNAFPNTPPTYHWAGSPNILDPTQSWVVGFGGPVANVQSTALGASVRCVRSLPLASGVPADRYQVDRRAETVTDTRTQLTWQRTVSAPDRTWEEAVAYCDGLGDGFRMPALNELLTLIDPVQLAPVLSPVFPGMDWEWVIWTRTEMPARVGAHVVVTTLFGHVMDDVSARTPVNGMPTGYTFHAWCVR